MSNDAILRRLTALHPRVIDLSLDRVRRLLARLGDPQDGLPPVVHVAGTNGKGSTLAFVRAMLEAAGRTVHVYTSPHLVRFNERIVVAGTEIADDVLAEVLAECERVNGDDPITFFEVTTAAAFLAFVRAPADAVLLETGLGGRLDATNVVARPAVTAITPVSIDHQGYLGDTATAIAGEKAGILKTGVACVVAEQTADAAAVIRARAADVGAPLVEQGTDWSVSLDGDGLVYAEPGRRLVLPAPGLVGRHQAVNAGTAIAVAGRLSGLEPDDDAIRAGLAGARWPARLQRLADGALAARLPAGWELWVDGGHNAAAAEALAGQARAWSDRPLHLVVGMLATKDARAFLAPLAPFVGRALCVDVPGEPATLAAADTVEAARAVGIGADVADDLASALDRLGREAPGPARVLVCGSLYLAGAALAANDAVTA